MVRVAFIATFPPRRCGIGVFTADLSRSTGGAEIVALDAPGWSPVYASQVHHRIRRDEPADYPRAARAVSHCVDVVSIQHEYGIWGGPDGDEVLDFVSALEIPAVTTLHTVLRQPTPHQRSVLVELVSRSAATVVMSESAAALLAGGYGVAPTLIEVIPHGVPDLPLVAAETAKPLVGLTGRDVILSFGLLGPGKGYELVLSALPAVVARHPGACLVIVGATHPDLVAREGETYRASLVDLAERLGMTPHVRFVDRFVTPAELIEWLQAADVFITPYPNMDQIVSGTLSYAMGAGRAIVSTPYAYAVERLAGGRGVLVPPSDPHALARALDALLADDDLRRATGQRAYAHSRHMVWSEVGARYRRLFDLVGGRTPATVSAPLAAPLLVA